MILEQIQNPDDIKKLNGDELKNACPEKFFYTTEGGMCCPDMKTITLDKVLSCLESGCGEVTLAASVAENALRPLKAMLEIAERK